jgi:hypothetical protein
MAIILVDHHLKDFASWLDMFAANPPPAIGRWRVLRGQDDPNRVYVVGEMDDSEVPEVKEYFASERMQEVFRRVNGQSTSPLAFVWLEDVTPR